MFAILLPLIFGCTTIAEKIADQMALEGLRHQHDIVLFAGDLTAFESRLEHRGGLAVIAGAAIVLDGVRLELDRITSGNRS